MSSLWDTRVSTVKPRWVCSYRGQLEIEWRGKRYELQYSAEDWVPGVWNYTKDEYERQVVARVGTIMSYIPRGDFPPDELAEFYPGYVLAKFDPSDWSVIYKDGKKPETVYSNLYGTLAAQRAKELVELNVRLQRV